MPQSQNINPINVEKQPSMVVSRQRSLTKGGWNANNKDTLIIIATLITALAYQMGTNIPGGYWQEDDGKGHIAGDPIMRDRNRIRYWFFMASSWMGFSSFMLMTMCLLIGIHVSSRLVRWPFLVAYSSLVLNFIMTQMRTPLPMNLVVWVLVLLILWLIVKCSQSNGFVHDQENPRACSGH